MYIFSNLLWLLADSARVSAGQNDGADELFARSDGFELQTDPVQSDRAEKVWPEPVRWHHRHPGQVECLADGAVDHRRDEIAIAVRERDGVRASISTWQQCDIVLQSEVYL